MEWWRTTAKLRPTTRRGYRGVLNHRVLPVFGLRRLGDISYLDIEMFIADVLDEGLSPKYVRECVSVVSLIMKLAVKATFDWTIPPPATPFRCRSAVSTRATC